MRVRTLWAIALLFGCRTEERALPAPIKEVSVAEAPAKSQSARPPLPGDPRHGWELFREHCVACHGASRRGTGVFRSNLPTPPADLRDPVLLTSRTNDQLVHAIMNGVRPSTQKTSERRKDMPAFGTELAEQDALDLVAFLRGDSIYLQECFPAATHYKMVPVKVPGPTLYAAHAVAQQKSPVFLSPADSLPTGAEHVGYVTFVELDIPNIGPTPVALISGKEKKIERVRVALPEPDNQRAAADIEAVLKDPEAVSRLRPIVPAIRALQEWMEQAI